MHPSLRASLASLCLALFGCQACGSASTQDPGPVAPSSVASPGPAPVAAPDEAPDEPVEPTAGPTPEPAPALSVGAEQTPRGLRVSISNGGREPVSFASTLVLERRGTEGMWERVTVRGELVARLDAERALPECAELVSGASLELDFDGMAGPECAPCEPPAAGDYRIVVTSCNGTGRTEGASVTIAP